MGLRKEEYLPHYMYDDYIQWEGDWEIIGGTAFAMSPAPMKKHQYVSSNIAYELKNSLKDCKNCQAYLPIDWKIAEDTVVQPDNLVLCNDNDNASYITKAPLIIFEILSKSTAMKDQHLKYELYQQEGVTYYIIVNPDDEVVKLYKLTNGKYIKEGDFDKQSYTFEIDNCEVVFDFSKIW
jgi:Uma2 family endonuclease